AATIRSPVRWPRWWITKPYRDISDPYILLVGVGFTSMMVSDTNQCVSATTEPGESVTAMTTGEVIRRIRKSYGMTQRELATLMGYTQPVISQLENNAPCVHDVRMLRRAARALHVPLAILVVD